MKCDPAIKVDTGNEAIPPVNETWPRIAPPSIKLTVPVAVDGVTVALRTVSWPATEGFTEDVNVVVGVDVRRRLADEVDEEFQLGPELGFDLGRIHPTADHPLQESPEREELPVLPDERRHRVRRENRCVEREAGVPAEFEGHFLLSPLIDRFLGIRRVDQEHRGGDRAALGQFQNAPARIRADAEVIGGHEQFARGVQQDINHREHRGHREENRDRECVTSFDLDLSFSLFFSLFSVSSVVKNLLF